MKMNEKLNEVFEQIRKYDMLRDIFHRWIVQQKLKKIDDREIIDGIGMAEMPKILYLLELKYRSSVQWIPIENDVMVRLGEINVANMSYLAVYLHFIEIKNNCLHIEGNISLPVAADKRNLFYIRHNGIRIDGKMSDHNLDCRLGKNIYEKRTVFSVEVQLEENDNQIEFFNCIDGLECKYGKINSMRFLPIADVLKNQYALQSNWLIWENGSHINLKKVSEEDIVAFENRFRDSVAMQLREQDLANVIDIRKEYFERKKEKRKSIWLFMDRIDKADDNGEAYFEYVCGRNPKNVECYFIISKLSPDYKRISRIGPVIDALSKEHCILLLLADYIFTSQLNGWTENPYGEQEEYFRDLYHHAKVVFLQHGVTKDDQTIWLNRYNQNLHAIVTSARKETEAFLTYPYLYEKRQIWETGMPRLDRLYNDNTNYILFMPTWRKGLMEQRWDEKKRAYRWYLKDEFWKSSYYSTYHQILNDKEFLKRCKKAGYRIIFMPHPIMQPYIGEFGASEEVVIMPYDASWRELFAESKIMITDYSSVAFDFAYLKKPIIYFHFDQQDFFKSHTYKEGYFDYENMGFGEIVTTKETLYKAIFKQLKRGCQEESIYEKRINDFYSYLDSKCCERIYKKVMEESNGISI